MGFFKTEKSLADLEEETEYQKSKKELLQEKVAIKQLEERLGKGGWKMFSDNGKRSGFSLARAWSWLKAH